MFILLINLRTDKGYPIICLSRHTGEAEVELQYILNPALEEEDGQHHTPAVYHLKTPVSHCKWGWVGLGVGLDVHGISRPHRYTMPGPPSPQRVSILTGPSRPPNNVSIHIKSRKEIRIFTFRPLTRYCYITKLLHKSVVLKVNLFVTI
jgi:hypothetical protein